MTQTPTQAYQIWHEVLADERFAPSSAAIQKYLTLTEGLESPVPYHVWSLLSLVAALCGDNIAINHGPLGRERLNLGVVLTGVPAVRKSTALTVMQKFAEGLPIQYGPTDTAGQRQGIMSAMMPKWQKDTHDDDSIDIRPETIDVLADLDTDSIVPALPNLLSRKASEIYFVSKELGRLIASQSRELFDFFTDGMDGETFHYQLKNQTIKIRNPLINLIGCTTPSSLGNMIPRGGDSHGFLSRLVFVHASHQTRRVAIPEEWNELQLQSKKQLHELILDQLDVRNETIGMTAAATKTYTDLYAYIPVTNDQRMQAYAGRRAKHMLKISALLAVLRGESPIVVQASDVRLAHALMLLTESNMDRSFHGLDVSWYGKCLSAITEIAETSSNETVSIQQIQTGAGHLGDKDKIATLVQSLQDQGKLVKHESQRDSWMLNQKQFEVTAVRLKTHFTHGNTPLGADEFRPHIVPKPQMIKGAAG